MIINVVEINKEDREQDCKLHKCYGHQVKVTTMVKYVKERMLYRNGGEEEDVRLNIGTIKNYSVYLALLASHS